MTYQHKELAAGRWQGLSLVEQMAHIGSEVERALNWRHKNNPAYFQKATDRAFELIDLTLASTRNFTCLKEMARVREALIDYFFGANEYGSSDSLWRKYFFYFGCLAQKNRS